MRERKSCATNWEHATAELSLCYSRQWLLATDHFTHPLTLSGMGMAFSSLAAFLCCRVCSRGDIAGVARHQGCQHPMARDCLSFSPLPQVFRLVEAKQEVSIHFYFTRILPVGLVHALTLALGNIVYLYLGVAFIQVCREAPLPCHTAVEAAHGTYCRDAPCRCSRLSRR